MRVKQAPSENWKEVVELWQCHDEDFDQFIDCKTKQIKVPDDVSLIRYNQLVLSKNIVNLKVIGEVGEELIKCKDCNEIIGLRSEEDLLFRDKIEDLKSHFSFHDETITQIYNHG